MPNVEYHPTNDVQNGLGISVQENHLALPNQTISKNTDDEKKHHKNLQKLSLITQQIKVRFENSKDQIIAPSSFGKEVTQPELSRNSQECDQTGTNPSRYDGN